VLTEKGAHQLAEGLLRASQVSGLEGLTDGVEIVLTLVYLECIPVGERAVLAQTVDGAEYLLRASKVSRLERMAELLQIGVALEKVRMQIQVNRTCGNCCR
jgi:hypothetical protein